MKIKELVAELKKLPQEANIVLSSDEELNIMYKDIHIAKLAGVKNTAVIWGTNEFNINFDSEEKPEDTWRIM